MDDGKDDLADASREVNYYNFISVYIQAEICSLKRTARKLLDRVITGPFTELSTMVNILTSLLLFSNGNFFFFFIPFNLQDKD